MTRVQSKDAFLYDIANDAGPLRDAMVATIGDATTTDAGLMAAADKTKLDGVAAGATANAADADLRDRTTHTGAQAMTTVTGLVDALAGKASAVQGVLASTALQPADVGTAAAAAATDFATAAQGALADTAIQAADLATVATTGAYSDLTGTPTLGTAAAADTGDFATAAQGALADTALQAIADGAVAYPSLDSDLQGVIDPLRGFDADGETDDTANFAALRLAYPLDDIDCKGAEYLITGDPADYGPTHNGYWVKAGYEGNIDVRIPMRGTMETARTTLTTGSGYAAWCQDNWAVQRGEVMAIWNEGGDHASGDDMNGVSMRLKNGVWTQKESILRDPTADYWISGGLVLDGVQYILRRTDSTNKYKLYMRHLSERFEFTDILNCGGTAGTKAFYVNLSDIPAEYGMIGAREGMKAIFTSVDVIGGNAISGEYTVNFINGTRIQWLHASDFSGEVLLAGGEFSVTFVESDWIECNIGGVQISDAIDAKWVAGGGTTSTFNLHSMTGISKDAGTFYCGVSGGDLNVAIAKIYRPFDTNTGATVSYVKEIPGDLALTEPTIWRDPANGYLYGFCRTQSLSVGAAFWWSANDLATAPTVTSLPTGGMTQSPIPLVGVGDYLYALASGTRTGAGDIVGAVPATVGIYIGKALKTSAQASGAAAFKWYRVDEVQFENHAFGAANAVGVGSIVQLDDKTLVAGYGGEVTGATIATGSSTTKAQIYALKVDVSDAVPIGRGRVAVDRVHNPLDMYWHIAGHGAAASGSIVKFTAEIGGIGPACYDPSTGYFQAPETGLYEVNASVVYEDGTAAEKYCEVVDDAGTNLLGTLLVGVASNVGTSTNEAHGTICAPVRLRDGQKMGLKVTAANGTRNSTTRGSLYIKKIT